MKLKIICLSLLFTLFAFATSKQGSQHPADVPWSYVAAGANTNTYNVVTDSGSVTIPAGCLKWSVTAVGGTCVVNIGSAGSKTLPSGYTLTPDAVNGFATAQAVAVANGTGTAYYSYQMPN